MFVALGVPQTLAGAVDATTLEGAKQTISIGPMASQEIIKELGTNGGGFFNANSAHPFENPNAWTNFLEIWALLLIPVASVLAFGRVVGDMRQGRAILAAMGVFLLVGVGVVYWSEAAGNPILTALGVDPSPGNFEGKEVRFGQAMSALFTTGTSGTSTGAVNSMFDSYTPLAGMVPMFNLLAGCIWPGGVGSGLYGFLVVAIIAVFVAGLMVGRTPEYLGKKIEAREMKLAMLAVLIYPLVVLGFSGASVLLQTALDSLNNSGPHGLSEIVYAYASTNANNGSAFAGLNGNTLWFNTTLRPRDAARPLRLRRSGAGAGRLVWRRRRKSRLPPGPSRPTVRCSSGCLVGVIVILYLLQYFPALSLGPVVEHFLMLSGKTYLIGDRPMSPKAKSQGLFDGKIIAAAAVDAVRKLDPRALAKNPVIFVTEVVSLMVTLFFLRDLAHRQRRGVLFGPDRRLAVVHGAVCEFRRGGRRRPGQGAGRRACGARAPTRPPSATSIRKTSPALSRASMRSTSAWAMLCWSRPARSSLATAKSLKAWPPSTNRRSPANPPPSSAKPAAIARPSPAARRCCPTLSR